MPSDKKKRSSQLATLAENEFFKFERRLTFKILVNKRNAQPCMIELSVTCCARPTYLICSMLSMHVRTWLIGGPAKAGLQLTQSLATAEQSAVFQ